MFGWRPAPTLALPCRLPPRTHLLPPRPPQPSGRGTGVFVVASPADPSVTYNGPMPPLGPDGLPVDASVCEAPFDGDAADTRFFFR